MAYKSRLLGFCLKLLVFVNFFAVAAEAQLLVTPTRLDFGPRDRSAKLTLINTSSEVTSYRFNLIDDKRNADGSLVFLSGDEHAEYSLRDMIRFSPRQVQLRPGQRQSVRVFLRRGRDLNLSEYRSRIVFNALPTEQRASRRQAEGAQMSMNLQLAVSVPVYMRTSKPATEVSLTGIQHIVKNISGRNIEGVEFELARVSGEHSSLGDLSIYFVPATGAKQKIGATNRLSLFAEEKSIKRFVPFTSAINQSGTLELDYKGIDIFEGTDFDKQSIRVAPVR